MTLVNVVTCRYLRINPKFTALNPDYVCVMGYKNGKKSCPPGCARAVKENRLVLPKILGYYPRFTKFMRPEKDPQTKIGGDKE